MFDFIYKHKINELKKIQQRQHELYKERKKYEDFPYPTMKKYTMLKNFERVEIENLAEQFTCLLTGIISFEQFQQQLVSYCPIINKKEYFEALGKFFIQLSGNMEALDRIKKELSDLYVEETKIKEQLGIE